MVWWVRGPGLLGWLGVVGPEGDGGGGGTCVCVYIHVCLFTYLYYTGFKRDSYVLSPRLHLSNFSLKLCTLCAVITSSLSAFYFSTVLCGKLYFPKSFTHYLILIFTCPLVLLSSVTNTRSSLSIFSMPFTISYIVIRSPLPFPSAFLHMLILSSFSVCVFHGCLPVTQSAFSITERANNGE
ncbi:hypothetical protein E2C01_034542 [Portunus trituberculatus]|uniref:Uncharacterized protein n=1 Tax=Portunus trituberculatus TaxID=210409 RepID=A0A5B7F6K8_PORTR|nr:hypothetical protein [Portunus trituberculatus]